MNQNVRRANAKKNCSICGREKVDNGKNWYRNLTCAACYMKRYKKTHPDRVRDARLKCYYNVTLEQYRTILRKQNFKCDICKRPENNLKNGKVQHFVVDHNHSTKKVRGLLCHTCNMRVGIMENWGNKIRKYLTKH